MVLIPAVKVVVHLCSWIEPVRIDGGVERVNGIGRDGSASFVAFLLDDAFFSLGRSRHF